MKLSEHFSSGELACRCGCGFCEVDRRLLETAEAVRSLLNAPMVVHSCCRCSAHNKAVGGVPQSRHLTGQAMDFHVPGLTARTVGARILDWYNRGFLPLLGGLGIYKTFVHIDTAREGRRLRRWEGRGA